MSDRLILVDIQDALGEPIPGAVVKVSVNGQPTGEVQTTNIGRATITVSSPSAIVEIEAVPVRKQVKFAENVENFVLRFEEFVRRGPTFWEKHFPAGIGICFLVITIALVFIFADPKPLQAYVILATLSVALGAIASEITGLLKVDIGIGTKVAISAAGALAVFVIIYFFKPAGLLP